MQAIGSNVLGRTRWRGIIWFAVHPAPLQFYTPEEASLSLRKDKINRSLDQTKKFIHEKQPGHKT